MEKLLLLGVISFLTYVILIASLNSASSNSSYIQQMFPESVDQKRISAAVYNRILRMKTLQMLALIVIIIGIVYNIYCCIWENKDNLLDPFAMGLGVLALLAVISCILVYNNTLSVISSWKRTPQDEKMIAADDLFSYSYNWTLIAMVLFIIMNGLCLAIQKKWIIAFNTSQSSSQTQSEDAIRPQSSSKISNQIMSQPLPQVESQPPIDLDSDDEVQIIEKKPETQKESESDVESAGSLLLSNDIEKYQNLIEMYKLAVKDIKNVYTSNVVELYSKLTRTYYKDKKEFNKTEYEGKVEKLHSIVLEMEKVLRSNDTELLVKRKFASMNSEFSLKLREIEDDINDAFYIVFTSEKSNFQFNEQLGYDLNSTVTKTESLYWNDHNAEMKIVAKKLVNLINYISFHEKNLKGKEFNKLWFMYTETINALKTFFQFYQRNINASSKASMEYAKLAESEIGGMKNLLKRFWK